MYKLPVSKLNDFFKAITECGQKLYLPVDGAPCTAVSIKGTSASGAKSAGAAFTEWHEGLEYSKALNTNRSAKDFFFPQTEDLYEVKMDGKNLEVIDTRREAENFVVFGVRACDARSFAVLDKVFLVDPVDTYYKNRREHATIISVACKNPAHTCFCSQMDIEASNPEGDIKTWITDDTAYFEVITQKGKDLIKSVTALSDESGKPEELTGAKNDSAEKAVAAEKAEIISKIEALPIKLPHDTTFDEANLKKVFSSPAWAKLSETCLGCGTCTFVCPTCQCYDIRDFDTGHGVKRFRCWDSCMYSDFTKMSAGQPRPTQLERFRQRFMHKLVYFPANNDGMAGCVGCGRCLAKCPISMNIVKVARSVAQQQNTVAASNSGVATSKSAAEAKKGAN